MRWAGEIKGLSIAAGCVPNRDVSEWLELDEIRPPAGPGRAGRRMRGQRGAITGCSAAQLGRMLCHYEGFHPHVIRYCMDPVQAQMCVI